MSQRTHPSGYTTTNTGGLKSRTFNGEKYHLASFYTHKASADFRAGYLRKNGYKVRVVRLSSSVTSDGHTWRYATYAKKK